MQNFRRFAPFIIKEGKFYASLGESRVALVDVVDVAAVTVAALTEDGHEEQTYEITGPRAYSYSDCAEILSRVLNKTVRFESVSLEAGHKALVDAIGEVYRSAHSASALAYRERMGIEGEPKMGVTVQRLVEAETAGVLFTHNPVTGAEERLIEAAWGLGEVVVSGLVVPDSYRISSDGQIVERVPGEKDVALRPSADGGIEEARIGPQNVRALVLEDAQLVALHELTLRCEAEYGQRLDIEWAFADGQLYLLQCRAITR